MECHAFLDTMMFLHFKPVEEIDWRRVTGADDVTLVVARI